MAHECPDCYMVCHCGGDIDDIEFDRLPRGGCDCPCRKEQDEAEHEFDNHWRPCWYQDSDEPDDTPEYAK